MRNVRLLLAFDGTGFHGWQVQPGARTVQGVISDAITRLTGERVLPNGSGRTDAGAHARGLVANFMTSSDIPAAQVLKALNGILPPDVRVLAVREVPKAFHARKDAISKIYRYQVFKGSVLPPHLAREHYHYPFPLELDRVRAGCALLIGEHDFAGFAAKSGRVRSGGELRARHETRRHLFRSEVKAAGRRLIFTFEGDGFLHHMVRNIVGTVLEVGRGRISLERVPELLVRRDRTLAGFTAPANGLILVRVRYGRLQKRSAAKQCVSEPRP
jgi:tRNA pseudouridine38-40 synthase